MNAWKTLFTAALTALTVYLQKMAVPVIVLVLVMILDYASGICSAWMRGEISSKAGIKGIAKKVGYLGLVIVGMVIDYLISNGMATVGAALPFDGLFATLIIVWLILNELTSIVENSIEIGLPVPNFLKRALEKMKKDIDKDIDKEETE